MIAICLEQLTDSSALLRQWLALCLAKVWTNFDNARWCGVRDSAHEKLYKLLTDTHPEVILHKLTLLTLSMLANFSCFCCCLLTSVNSEIFTRVLFSQNSASKEFRKNKPLVRWQKLFVLYCSGKSCKSREFLTGKMCLLTQFAKIKFLGKFPNLQYFQNQFFQKCRLETLSECQMQGSFYSVRH